MTRYRLWISETVRGTVAAQQSYTVDSGADADYANRVVRTFTTAAAPFNTTVDDFNRAVLPEVARAIADSQMQAISGRLSGAGGGHGGGGGYGLGGGTSFNLNMGGQSTLEGVAASRMRELAEDGVDWKRVIGNSSFDMPVALGAGHGSGGIGGGAFWGGGDFRSIGGKGENGIDWSGDLFAAHLGFDAQVSERASAGLALSYNEAELDDYTYRTAAGANAILRDYTLEMTSLSPYLGWRGATVEGYLMVGVGAGELSMDDDGVALESDVDMQTIGGGVSGTILRRDNGREVRMKAEAFGSNIEVEGGDEVVGARKAPVPAADLNASLVRLLVETNRTHTTARGSLTPSAEMGVRYDDGDGLTGGGIELGGGVGYTDAGRGLTMGIRARGLVGHSADYDDWGVSVRARLASGADGQGLSLTVAPAYGNTDGGAQGMWDNGLFTAAGDASGDSGTATDRKLRARMAITAGFGLRAFTATGLLTPHAGMTFANDANKYRLGLEWKHANRITFDLTGERTTGDATTTDSITLKGEVKF